LLTAAGSPLVWAVVTQSQLYWKGFYPPVAHLLRLQGPADMKHLFIELNG
jgi:hypothetical protein